MKSNLPLILNQMYDHVKADDFFDIIQDFHLTYLWMADSEFTDGKEEMGALIVNFVKTIKDYEKVFRFVLDKVPYPDVEVV